MGSSIPRTPPGRKVTFYTVPSVAPSLHHHGILVYCCNSVIIRNPLPAESYKTIKGFDVFFRMRQGMIGTSLPQLGQATLKFLGATSEQLAGLIALGLAELTIIVNMEEGREIAEMV
ncbi:hypothetical protein Ac2012v2_006764 [Leucoagaricus gongylophorus]